MLKGWLHGVCTGHLKISVSIVEQEGRVELSRIILDKTFFLENCFVRSAFAKKTCCILFASSQFIFAPFMSRGLPTLEVKLSQVQITKLDYFDRKKTIFCSYVCFTLIQLRSNVFYLLTRSICLLSFWCAVGLNFFGTS